MTEAARADAAALVRTALRHAEGRGWRSHDPFDLLLAPALRPLRRSQLPARVAVQLGMRGGTALRRVLRVPQHEEPLAVAQGLRAAALLARAGERWASDALPGLVGRLERLASPEGGWGLRFPYASRFVAAPAGAPNAYTTLVAAEALLDAGADPSTAVRFLTGVCGTIEREGRTWLRYWPGSDAPIVNVQALAAGVLARPEAGDHAELTARLAATVVAEQRPEGSWPYSADGRAPFVDSLHTGFVLDGLTSFSRQGGDAGVAEALSRGLAFYRRELLTPDGRPRAFAGGRPRLDGQNLGGAVGTLIAVGDLGAAERLWRAEARPRLARLEQPNARPSLRWEVAPLAVASASLAVAQEVSSASSAA